MRRPYAEQYYRLRRQCLVEGNHPWSLPYLDPYSLRTCELSRLSLALELC